MAPDETPTTRQRIHQLLTTATSPLTTRHIAEQVGTDASQAARALRRLEDDGYATHQRAAGGCYAWTSTDTPASRTR